MKACKDSWRTVSKHHFLSRTLVWIVLMTTVTRLHLTSASHLPTHEDDHKNDDGTPPPPPIVDESVDLALLERIQEAITSPINHESTGHIPPTANAMPGKRYTGISAFCDERQMTIFGQFVEPFKGRIYTYGYSDEPECGVTSVNDPAENVTFLLPLGHCGVQMTALDDNLENDLVHEVTLYIQYSSYLQQIIDEKVTVSCVESKSDVMDDISQSLDDSVQSGSSRQGRRLTMLKDPGVKGSMPKISTKIGEAWMEILAGKDPAPKSKKALPIAVGEDVTLVISTKVMRGYDARIVNCTAHDGSRTTADGYRAQQILDSAGCSVDKALVPNFRRRRLPIESRNRLITLHFATFPAFKFPERDHLHIRCSVVYCQGPCPQEPCDSGINHFGTWREKYGRIADVLVDSSEIVNSVEVSAPELEDIGGGHHYERHQATSAGSPGSSSYSSGGGGEERTSRQFVDSSHTSNPTPHHAHSTGSNASPSMFTNSQVPLLQPNPALNGNNVCVSPGTVILALVILGVVLVISATATLWFALKRSEAKKFHQKHAFNPGPQPYYRFSHW